jgi:hypothetical protein
MPAIKIQRMAQTAVDDLDLTWPEHRLESIHRMFFSASLLSRLVKRDDGNMGYELVTVPKHDSDAPAPEPVTTIGPETCSDAPAGLVRIVRLASRAFQEAARELLRL